MAGNEEDRFGLAIDCRVHPDTAAQCFVEVSILCQRCFFCSDVTMHDTASCIFLVPDTLMTLLRNRVESPGQLAAVGTNAFTKPRGL